MVIYILMFGVLLALTVQDIRTKEISSKLLIALAVISVIGAVIGLWRGNLSPVDLVISFIPGAILLLLSVISRQQMGFGDGITALILGPAFGIKIVTIGLLSAFFMGGIFSIILIITKEARAKSRIPFLPFMTMGMVVACFAKI